MKFLCDMGVPMNTARALREKGHDVVHLREERLHKLPDEDIVEKAQIAHRRPQVGNDRKSVGEGSAMRGPLAHSP